MITATADPLKWFLTTWRDVLLRPSLVFRSLDPVPQSTALAKALVFAILCKWIGSAVAWSWSLNSFSHFSHFSYLSEGSTPAWFNPIWVEWFSQAGSVLLNPFSTILGLLFKGSCVWLGCRVLGMRQVRLSGIVQILSYACAPAIILAVPFVGWLIASTLAYFYSWVGFRETLGASSNRATFLALCPLFPYLFIFGIILFGSLVFAVFLARLFGF